jgi:uncharacterized protein
MKRYLESFILDDLREKIVMLSGPRQVGKTTLSRQIDSSFAYLSYDSAADRKTLRNGQWPRDVRLVVFDELHKMRNWKSWIKGVYDTEGVRPGMLVTGSARLDILRKGGDSLAGRYHHYRLHPLTVRELTGVDGRTSSQALESILRFGGFPEPCLTGNETAARRWRRTHLDTIIRQDLLDLERVRDIKSIEILVEMMRERVGSPVSYSSLARDLQVSVPTVKHWLQILENLYVIFPVRPYHRNVARSVLKEPKYYLLDNGAVEGGEGARLENAAALALLRELHLIEDTTGARVALHYLRDKEKREVDFLAVVDGHPVLLLEVKEGQDSFSRHLARFAGFFPRARAVQAVAGLRQRKSSGHLEMWPAHEFLSSPFLEGAP